MFGNVICYTIFLISFASKTIDGSVAGGNERSTHFLQGLSPDIERQGKQARKVAARDEEADFGFFDISIHDSNGTDISDRTLVRHHNYTGSNSSPQRVHSRTVSRPQNQCPHPYWPIFEGSRCRHEFSPQSYIMTCTGEHDITYDWVSGRCADSEICVNGQITRESVNGHWWVAYCVNTENFVAIAQDQTGTVANFNAASGKSGYVVEALLTGLDSRTSLVAQSLKIQAQAYELISNTHVWGTLANGSYECANCASVEIPSVPIGTQRIKVNLVLRTASAGLLYLASIVSL